MRKYVTYKRVSGGENQKSGLGLDAQERDIQLFLENYSETPYEVLGEFVEVQTGTDNERPQLRAAIALAKEHQATLVEVNFTQNGTTQHNMGRISQIVPQIPQHGECR